MESPSPKNIYRVNIPNCVRAAINAYSDAPQSINKPKAERARTACHIARENSNKTLGKPLHFRISEISAKEPK